MEGGVQCSSYESWRNIDSGWKLEKGDILEGNWILDAGTSQGLLCNFSPCCSV